MVLGLSYLGRNYNSVWELMISGDIPNHNAKNPSRESELVYSLTIIGRFAHQA